MKLVSLFRRWHRLSSLLRCLLLLVFLIIFPLYLYFLLRTAVGLRELIEEEHRPDRVFSHEETLSSAINSKTAALSRFHRGSSKCLQDVNVAKYPQCLEKVDWMRIGWKTHECYGKNGVKGDDCSIRKYLSEIESFCPPINATIPRIGIQYATIETNLHSLFQRFVGHPVHYEYIRSRIGRIWEKWVEAAKELETQREQKGRGKRKKKRIMLHLGFLVSTKFGEKSTHGGPLGELLQWADLMASLHVLGHELWISSDKATLFDTIQKFSRGPCPSKDGIDLIFTDIMGISHLKKRKEFLLQNKCRLRLLDSFGTQAEFNHRAVFSRLKPILGGDRRNPWGGHGFDLGQFMTFFPHSDDNSYLGFVVVPPEVSSETKRAKATLVYGKEQYMWEKHNRTIQIASEFGEVHATVADASNAIPDFVINHGFQQETGVHSLLRSVKIFLGLGFPFEGPAPFEAIANGAVFINAKFNPPKSRMNDLFFKEKPTMRELSSQSEYAAELGEPYVITVDIEDDNALRDAFRRAMQSEPSPFIPAQLTPFGMLLRVSLMVEQQDFCNEKDNWIPKEALQVRSGSPNMSCSAVCKEAGMRCERSFFQSINEEESIASHFKCLLGVVSTGSLTAPSVSNKGECRRQSAEMLYNCARAPDNGDSRLCPCTERLDGHSSICKLCY